MIDLETHPFATLFGVDETVAAQALSEAMGKGAEFADLYFQHVRSTSLSLEDGIISRANTGVDQGVGIRAVIGDQVGYAFSESLQPGAIYAAARTAAAIAEGAKNVPPQNMRYREPDNCYAIDRDWDEVDIAERLPLVQRAETAIRAMEPAVEKVSVGWMDRDERVLIVTSDGVFSADRRPMATLYCSVTANKNGVRQSNGASVSRREGIGYFTEEHINAVCQKAVDRTMILFEARRPPAGEMPVVLAAGASGILLHEAIGHGLEADFNRKGTSIYAAMMNEKVAPDFVTIVDDGLQENDRGALNIDDEGQSTACTTLIENGVLKSYLHDRISAKHYGVSPTGSGPPRGVSPRSNAAHAIHVICSTGRTPATRSSPRSTTASSPRRSPTGRCKSARATSRFTSKMAGSSKAAKSPRPSKMSISLATGPKPSKTWSWPPATPSWTAAVGRAAKTVRACRFQWACRRCWSKRV